MTQTGTQVAANPVVIPEGDPLAAYTDRSLLIVDDDKPFSTRLARAMEARGYHVHVAESVAEGVAAVEAGPPAFAVIDMRLGDGNGLDVIARLKERRPEARGVILTGYGNIATAVTAVKLGAFDYLAKPADADEIHGTLMAQPGERADPPEKPDVRRPGALGAHPAGLRIGNRNVSEDRPPAQHAPAHAPAHPGQARAALTRRNARPR